MKWGYGYEFVDLIEELFRGSSSLLVVFKYFVGFDMRIIKLS